jgi:hypothetical protein
MSSLANAPDYATPVWHRLEIIYTGLRSRPPLPLSIFCLAPLTFLLCQSLRMLQSYSI